MSSNEEEHYYHSNNELKVHQNVNFFEKELATCQNKINNKSKRDISSQYHSKVKLYSCPTCLKEFLLKCQLDAHLKTHFNKYICSICQKHFQNRYSLAKHLKIHDDNTYNCPTCQKNFTLKSNLAAHMKIHSGLKPHSCKICDKQFTRKSHLEAHILTHSGTKSYICPTCNMQYTQKSNLYKHLQIHSGEKKHICSTCGKGFTFKSSLKNHNRIHSGVKPYSCPKCIRTFADRGNLSKHLKTHAKQESSLSLTDTPSLESKLEIKQCCQIEDKLISDVRTKEHTSETSVKEELDDSEPMNSDFSYEVPVIKQEISPEVDLAAEAIPSSSYQNTRVKDEPENDFNEMFTNVHDHLFFKQEESAVSE